VLEGEQPNRKARRGKGKSDPIDAACYLLDAVAVPDADGLAEGALSWYDTQPPGPAPLIFSSLAQVVAW
jgi:hypothetical protein